MEIEYLYSEDAGGAYMAKGYYDPELFVQEVRKYDGEEIPLDSVEHFYFVWLEDEDQYGWFRTTRHNPNAILVTYAEDARGGCYYDEEELDGDD